MIFSYWFPLVPITDPWRCEKHGAPWIPSIYPLDVSIYTSTMDPINNVQLVKIEEPVWYTIYHHSLLLKGFLQTPLLINQPMGKGHLWIRHGVLYHLKWFCWFQRHSGHSRIIPKSKSWTRKKAWWLEDFSSLRKLNMGPKYLPNIDGSLSLMNLQYLIYPFN